MRCGAAGDTGDGRPLETGLAGGRAEAADDRGRESLEGRVRRVQTEVGDEVTIGQRWLAAGLAVNHSRTRRRTLLTYDERGVSDEGQG
jgi:hypothetical protein